MPELGQAWTKPGAPVVAPVVAPASGGAFVAPTSTPSAGLGLAMGHRSSPISKIIHSRLKLVQILLGCSLRAPEELPSVTEAERITAVDSMSSESSGLGPAARLAVVVLVETAPGTTRQGRIMLSIPGDNQGGHQQEEPKDGSQNNQRMLGSKLVEVEAKGLKQVGLGTKEVGPGVARR